MQLKTVLFNTRTAYNKINKNNGGIYNVKYPNSHFILSTTYKENI